MLFDRHKPISCLLPAAGLLYMVCLFSFENLMFFMDLVWLHWGDEIRHSVSMAESALMALVWFMLTIH